MNYENNTKHEYTFLIRGMAQFEPEGEFVKFQDDNHRSEKAVSLLNSRRVVIAENINRAIERNFPSNFDNNVKVETRIEFTQGSVTWIGVITVLDWVGKIVDTNTFMQLMTSAIQFAVNKVISQAALQNSIPIQHETIETTARPNFVPTSQTDLLYNEMLSRQDEQLKILRNLTQNLNTLLVYIGDLREKNSAFRLSSYNNRTIQQLKLNSTQPSRWETKDIIILAVLMIVLLIQATNYFHLDFSSVRGWLIGLIGIAP